MNKILNKLSGKQIQQYVKKNYIAWSSGVPQAWKTDMISETQCSPLHEETKEDSYDHNKAEKASDKLNTHSW